MMLRSVVLPPPDGPCNDDERARLDVDLDVLQHGLRRTSGRRRKHLAVDANFQGRVHRLAYRRHLFTRAAMGCKMQNSMSWTTMIKASA